jgi:hypothetical protein
MTTRRTLLGLAGAAVLGGCTGRRPDPPAGGHRLVVTTADGASVLDQDGRVVSPPVRVLAATTDWTRVVTATADGTGTRVVVGDLAEPEPRSTATLAGRLEPRIVTPGGDLVASVTPGGAGPYGLHQPGGRERTTVVVSGATGERVRLDLPGNLEPDAFAPDGSVLFVLEYVPAGRPERYRAGAVDLAAGRLLPVERPLPETRAQRLEALHDPRRSLLFTLYADRPAALAYVDCLHLVERWTRRIPLPAPFGQERPGVHAIALSPAGDRLCVVHAPSASVAELDPDALAVKAVTRFASSGRAGKPNAGLTAAGRLVVNVDGQLIATGPAREIATAGAARGLVLGAGDDVWVGHPAGVVRYDLASGAGTGRIAVPGLYVVKRVR